MQHIKGLQIGTYLINALLPQKDKKKNEKKKNVLEYRSAEEIEGRQDFL